MKHILFEHVYIIVIKEKKMFNIVVVIKIKTIYIIRVGYMAGKLKIHLQI